MKNPRFTPNQIKEILTNHETNGKTVAETCREHAISTALFYQWKEADGRSSLELVKEIKKLKSDMARMQKLYAKSQMHIDIQQELLRGK